MEELWLLRWPGCLWFFSLLNWNFKDLHHLYPERDVIWINRPEEKQANGSYYL